MAGKSTWKWAFKPRFRARALGWRGSRHAIERLSDAVAEIRAAGRQDPIAAAGGAVELIERIWPAFEQIDTSSGALGSAVDATLRELIPLIASAPADPATRSGWLDRLWQAILDDGVSYLSPVEERWGELCPSREVASHWADRILPELREVWPNPARGIYVPGSMLCLSSLLTAGRHEDLFDVLALLPLRSWSYRRFGVRAWLAQGRTEEALAYAEASRGINVPNPAVDAECESILLAASRRGEAYARYALSANQANTGLATFRQLVKKYPEIEPERILRDLAGASGDPGRWFAAAKDAGRLALALEFARAGRTDPKTLSRAARDFAAKDPAFALSAGRLAVARILAGQGYEISAADLDGAAKHFLAAARVLAVEADARQDLALMLADAGTLPPLFRGVIERLLKS